MPFKWHEYVPTRERLGGFGSRNFQTSVPSKHQVFTPYQDHWTHVVLEQGFLTGGRTPEAQEPNGRYGSEPGAAYSKGGRGVEIWSSTLT